MEVNVGGEEVVGLQGVFYMYVGGHLECGVNDEAFD